MLTVKKRELCLFSCAEAMFMKVINTDQCSGESMNGITHLFKQLAFLDMTEKTHGGQL